MLAATLALAVVGCAYAESRARHFTADELREQADWVFEGVVCAIETVSAYGVSFPVAARVTAVSKGRWLAATMTFVAPHPGLHAIFPQEFEPPAVGQAGTFYVREHLGVRRLIGYHAHRDGDAQAAEPATSAGAAGDGAGDGTGADACELRTTP